ncbi:hypothetical protein EDD18DRAFT_1151454 [Armillaria luteobubalina]|uniref:Uncharacterized protein n=1 Tax=Armillaria luteobubalina TaxID=153913 RepID=A0AA39QAW4_9AGAR|nr:hypothetical protein EDD18DRAFT_1151454 [Armillaria luteobubalina]
MKIVLVIISIVIPRRAFKDRSPIIGLMTVAFRVVFRGMPDVPIAFRAVFAASRLSEPFAVQGFVNKEGSHVHQ